LPKDLKQKTGIEWRASKPSSFGEYNSIVPSSSEKKVFARFSSNKNLVEIKSKHSKQSSDISDV
jgi:hypothetical protein